MFDERQDLIVSGNLVGNVPSGPGYLSWLSSRGFTQAQFTASNFVVDVSDSGIDNGSASPTTPASASPACPGTSRVAYNRLEAPPTAAAPSNGCDGHGNLNSHIVSGYDDFAGFPFADPSGYHYGLGVCPFVHAGSSVIFDPSTFTSPNYATLQSRPTTTTPASAPTVGATPAATPTTSTPSPTTSSSATPSLPARPSPPPATRKW